MKKKDRQRNYCVNCGETLRTACDEYYDNQEQKTTRYWYAICPACKLTHDAGDIYDSGGGLV